MATATTSTPVNIQTNLFINGEFVPAESGKTAPTLNPHDNTKIADVAQADKADVDKAVNAAKAAFPKWAGMAAIDRGRLLLKLADLIEENKEELATVESLDTGHPMRDTMGLDVARTAVTFRYFGGMADKFEGSVIPVEAGFFNYLLRQPIGIVGQIVPWNFPIMFTSWKMGPALAAGNCVVLKPAALTPLSSLKIAELMDKAGIPKGVVNILPGAGSAVGQYIAEHPGIGKVSFTGSTDVGRGIVQGVGRQPEARAARTGRQGREHRVRRRHRQRGRQRIGVRDLPQPGPGVHRRLAPHPARVDRRRVHREVHQARHVDQDRQPARSARPSWDRSPRSAIATRSSATARSPRTKAGPS